MKLRRSNLNTENLYRNSPYYYNIMSFNDKRIFIRSEIVIVLIINDNLITIAYSSVLKNPNFYEETYKTHIL